MIFVILTLSSLAIEFCYIGDIHRRDVNEGTREEDVRRKVAATQ